MLLLDLDDTIFETKSMSANIFDEAIDVIKNYYNGKQKNFNAQEVINALWSIPVDEVFTKYQTEDSIKTKFYKKIAEIDYTSLDIKPFPDYPLLQEIKMDKILVTTGLKELQEAKIKALGIAEDFDQILIDDPRLVPRNNKIDLFKEILENSKLDPEQVWVIGDNPDSEIQAGHALGMKTIQRKASTKAISDLADYLIDSFEELPAILNQ